MANRNKFWHFRTSEGFYSEILKNTGLTDTEENRILALESNSNGCYYYIVFIKNTNQIYTHGCIYDCSKYDDTELRELISNFGLEIEENERVVAAALTDFNNNKADITDLDNKQDILVSGTNIKTINGESLLGEGDIETSAIKYKSMISDGAQATWEDYDAEINTINYIDLHASAASGVSIHVPYLIESTIEGDTPNTYSKECQILLRPGNPQITLNTNASKTIGGITPYIIWTNGEPVFSSDYLYEISFKGYKDTDGIIKYLAVYVKYEIE